MMKEMNISGSVQKSRFKQEMNNQQDEQFLKKILFYSSPLHRNNGSGNSLNIFEICLHNKG